MFSVGLLHFPTCSVSWDTAQITSTQFAFWPWLGPEETLAGVQSSRIVRSQYLFSRMVPCGHLGLLHMSLLCSLPHRMRRVTLPWLASGGPLWFPTLLWPMYTILSLDPLKMILVYMHHLSPARTLTEPLAVNNDFYNLSSPFCRATQMWPGARGMPPPGSP